MQVQTGNYSNEKKDALPKLETGLIQSTIVLAPDLVDISRLINNLRMYSLDSREMKLKRLKELADKNLKAKDDSERFIRCFIEIYQKVRELIMYNHEPCFKDEGERQGCMWLLCTIFCDGMNLPNKKNVFYSGVGFGEFWAVTYRMAQIGQISFREAVCLAKSRGDRLSMIADETYYTVFVREKERQALYKLFPKNASIGVLAVHNNRYFVYGKEKDLKKVANVYGVKMRESIPFFTQYTSQFVRSYAKRFPYADSEVDSQVILAREDENMEKMIIRQCCSRYDEQVLRNEISYYEPNIVREI